MKRITFITFVLLSISLFFFLNQQKTQSTTKAPKLDKAWKVGMGIGTAKDKFARFTREREMLVDPATQQLPDFIREKELMFAQTIGSAPPSLTEEPQWESRGPYNIGGRTRAFAIDVADENTFIAGSISGGIWKSIDAGANWYKVNTTGQNLSVTTIVQDPREGHTSDWYYGTGELFGASQSGAGAFYLGNGVYKSTDNGETWTPLPMTNADSPDQFISIWQGVWRLAIDPSTPIDQPAEIYAATYSTIFRSANGGDTWASVHTSPLSGNVSYFTEIALTSEGVAYAGMSREDEVITFGLSPIGGVWRAADGINYVNVLPDSFPPTYNRIVLGINPSDENEVYVLVSNVDPDYGQPGGNPFQETQYNALWRYNYLSGDGTGEGGQWTELTENLYIGPDDFDDFYPQTGYDLMVAVKPDEPNVVFVGGTNLYRSTDGFTTKENVKQVGGYQIATAFPNITEYPNHHPDQHGVTFLPSNPDVMFSYSDGGVARTDDVNADSIVWHSLNNGYVSTQFYTVTINQSDSSEVVMGGLQDNGTLYTGSTDPLSPWNRPLAADGSYCAIPDHGEYIIASTQSARIAKVQINEQGEPIIRRRFDPALPRDAFQFINAFALDPVDNKILYLPTRNRLWINLDTDQYEMNNNFDSTSVGWSPRPDSLLVQGLNFTSIATGNAPSHRVYLGTSNRRVYKIEDGTDVNSPMEEITSNLFPAGNVSCIAVDPSDDDKLMVIFSNYGVYSIFYSENAGESWFRTSGNLEQVSDGSGNGPSVRWASILPITPDSTMYLVGTSVGLFQTPTLNLGSFANWSQASPNEIGTNIVTSIASRPTDGFVAVGTHGNGVFSGRYDVDFSMSVSTDEVQKFHVENVKAFPNPASDQVTLSFQLAENKTVTAFLYDELGRRIKTISPSTKLSSGTHQIPFQVTDLPSGIYYCSLIAGEDKKTISLIVK